MRLWGPTHEASPPPAWSSTSSRPRARAGSGPMRADRTVPGSTVSGDMSGVSSIAGQESQIGCPGQTQGARHGGPKGSKADLDGPILGPGPDESEEEGGVLVAASALASFRAAFAATSSAAEAPAPSAPSSRWRTRVPSRRSSRWHAASRRLQEYTLTLSLHHLARPKF